MHSIYCGEQDEVVEYTDKQGNKHIIKYEAKDLRFGRIIDNGCEEGIKQRVHQELLMLRGEVVGQENTYGIDWQYIYDNQAHLKINDGTLTDEQKKDNADYRQTIINDIANALMRIGNVIKVVSINLEKQNNILNIRVILVYNGIGDKAEILDTTYSYQV